MSDPYLIPDSFVLKNKLDITDLEKLQKTESEYAKLRSLEFIQSNRNLQVSMQSLKTIHKLLIRDVYEWAGQFRTIYISKENDYGITRFLPPDRIASDGTKAIDHLKTILKYVNRDPFEKVMSELADVYLEMNHVHPFREGNGRSQKLFFRNVLKQHGITLDWSKVSKADHIEAAVQGGRGDPSQMREQFNLIGSRHNANDLSSPRPR